MHRKDCFHRLDFDDHEIMHEQINAIADIELHTVIHNWKRNLDITTKADALQFVPQTGFVSAFQQSRPKLRMNFHSSRDDLMADFVCTESAWTHLDCQ